MMNRRFILQLLAVLLLIGGCAAPAVPAADTETAAVELVFPSNQYPETALHIYGAIEQGASAICTIDRQGADANRKASLAGIETRDGYDRDEWPMAMCEEGGEGASVAYIDASDNRGAGSWVGNRLAEYPNGTKVRFIVEKPRLTFDRSAAAAAAEPSGSSDDANAVSYPNCAAVREAGKAPLYRGDPGYSAKLDRDRDGIACE